MIARFLVTACAVAAFSTAGPVREAHADAGDVLGGLIVGGLIGSAIANQNNGRTTRTTRVVRPGIPATQQGRETQVALNYFGFNAGSVDGQVGAGTRSAIERYQATMGYPVNGRQFSSYQFDFLMDAYYWSVNGGQAQTRLTGQPLLMAYRTSVQNGGSIQATVPQPVQPPATTVIVNPQTNGTTTATNNVPATTTVVSTSNGGSDGAMPNLFAGGGNTESLANRCNAVMLQTSTNGGYTTLASMTDPEFTMGEQFCVARSYAISQGEEAMQGITGLTQAQISEQCGQLTGMLGSQIDAVSLSSQGEAEAGMRSFALDTGIPPADLAATARVCLAVGYRQDDMRMAVGSALLLSSMGEAAYGELLGHHLLEGFGTTTRRDLAAEWYNASLTAIENGAAPAFMPGQPERVQLLRAASERLSGNTMAPAPIPASTGTGTALPTFTVNQ
ncbi:MAG: peptidoglycan-binding domain-containing protein [Pseudomonadota bacterium]